MQYNSTLMCESLKGCIFAPWLLQRTQINDNNQLPTVLPPDVCCECSFGMVSLSYSERDFLLINENTIDHIDTVV